MRIPVAAVARLRHSRTEFEGIAIRDRFPTAFPEPLSHGADDPYRFFRNGSIAARTDIQQQIAVSGARGQQHIDDFDGSFPILIGGVVSPMVVERDAGFPRPPRGRRGQMLFRRAEISRQTVPPVEEQSGLDRAQFLIHAFRLPAFRIEWPPAVIPEDIDRFEDRYQFFQTRERVFDENLIGLLIFQGTDRILVEIPDVDDPEEVARIIGTPAHLEFRDPNGNVVVEGKDITTENTSNLA